MNVRPVLETPYERRGITTPGLPILPHGVERYPLPGGGSRTVSVRKGDEISVLDKEGLQPAELVFFDSNGIADPAMIGAPANGDASGIKTTLAANNSGMKVLGKLAEADFDLGTAKSARLFTNGSRAGDMETFFAVCDGLLIVAAPGEPMQPEEQDAPSEVVLYIRRAEPADAKAHLRPPDPLADPSQDINIQPGEAKGFEVRAGEFIQIVDVQGRECSDFQAFSRRALDKGLEREIDPTTTRSLMGSLYPAPGIFPSISALTTSRLSKSYRTHVGVTIRSASPVLPDITRISAILVMSIVLTISTRTWRVTASSHVAAGRRSISFSIPFSTIRTR